MPRRGLFATASATPALAQGWRSERPIEIILGFVAGGATEVDAWLCRAVGQSPPRAQR